MKITEYHGLPFITIVIEFRGQRLHLENVLIDTGSASTLLNADIVRDIGIVPEKDDIVETIRGVGGVEYEMNGIIGFNLLKLVGAKIDVDALEIIVD